MPQISQKKILIVDDESHVISYLEALLQDHGYATISAADGVEGMEKVRQEKPDLVTLDASMPKKSGIGMFRDMREDPELKNIPIVMVTAVTGQGGDPEVFHKFLDSQQQVPPPDAFIAKPIEKDAFIKVIGEVLGRTANA